MRLAVLMWAGATVLAAAAWSEPAFVGAEQCKLCHRDIYDSWRRTPHASTGTVDLDGEARCNTCHATDVSTRRRGVQCEACHGAGGDYWPAEVMIDPDKATMAGLERPTLGACRRCHGSDEPDHEPDFVPPSSSEFEVWVHIRDEP